MLDRSSHILIVCIEMVSSVEVGILFPLSDIAKKGMIETRFVRTSQVTPSDIAWCDTVICVRGSEIWDLYVVKLCRKYGRNTIYFLDDDLLDIPDNVSCTDYYRDDYVRNNIISIMQECEVLWCVNPNISRKYADMFNEVILTDACVKPIDYDGEKKYDDKIVSCIYAGGIDHQGVVKEILSPVVRRICMDYGGKVHFTFIGVDPDLPDCDQVLYIPFIYDYNEYRQTLYGKQYDISFAPIYDLPFYRCKYYNKFLEYTAMGAVGIYSATEPYTFIVEDKVNGMLASDPDSWYDSVAYLIDHPNERRDMLNCALDILYSRFIPEKVGEKLFRMYPEVLKFCAPDIDFKKIHINRFKLNFLYICIHFRMYLKRRGVGGIFILPFKVIKVIIRAIRKQR